MAILKVKDENGIVTEILSIKGKSGKSPIIQDGYWWNYNDSTGEYENTGISVGNLISVGDTEPDTELWIDTSDTNSETIEITFDDNDNGKILINNGANTDWLKGKRCLAKKVNNSLAICYLDNNNSELFHDGITHAALDGSMGQWLVELPEYYFAIDESESGKHVLKITNVQNSGLDWSKRTYIGVTKGVIIDNKLCSVKGQSPTVNTTIQDFHKAALNSGVGYDIIDYETRCKLALMYFAKFSNRDSQDSLILGTSNITGTTSSLGNNTGNSTSQHSLFGIEDSFGNIWEMTSGVLYNENSCYVFDGYNVDSKPNEHRSFFIPEASGYINKIQLGSHGDIIPSELGGSSSTGFCDYGILQNTTGWNILLMGGNTADGTKSGLFAISLANDNSYSASDCGSRLQYKGNVIVIDDPNEFIAL